MTESRKRDPGSRALQALVLAVLLGVGIDPTFAQRDRQRGQYLAEAGGCVGCHTEQKKDAVAFAGGRALKTPFGTFFGPNITPDPEAGIGRWTEADFVRAMRHGKRPDGANYFPAFPYPSFTLITDRDLRDLWAFLRTLPPSSRVNQPHDLRIPYRWRFFVSLWNWLYLEPGPFRPDPARSDAVNRGAYLVQALSHCGECHTPRTFLGGPDRQRLLAGGEGPDGKGVPNITPARLKKWSDAEFKEVLSSGMLPDGDAVAEPMDEVVRNSTSQLTPEDLAAMIAYLRSVPPVESPAKTETKRK
jgi:mono/diheme cytochrome c family protein